MNSNEQMPVIQVLLVDDHAPMRVEIRSMIDREKDMTVIAESGTGEEGVEKAAQLQPDVVIMDILLPDMSGFEATSLVRKGRSCTRVIALSNHSGPIVVKTLRSAGGSGYVLKNHAGEDLIPAIREVAAGRTFLGQHVTE